MNNATSQNEEFEITLENGSGTIPDPPKPPAAPKLVVLVPTEFDWKIDFKNYEPGIAIEISLRGGQP